MPLESSDSCPCCRHRVVLAKAVSGHFSCPDCLCEFRHNTKKWLVGIPVGLIVAVALLYFTYDTIVPPLFVAFLAVGIVALLLSRIPTYVILAPGRVANK